MSLSDQEQVWKRVSYPSMVTGPLGDIPVLLHQYQLAPSSLALPGTLGSLPSELQAANPMQGTPPNSQSLQSLPVPYVTSVGMTMALVPSQNSDPGSHFGDSEFARLSPGPGCT